MTRFPWILLLLALALAAACGGSDGGNGPGGGGGGGNGDPVCTQDECEADRDYREVDQICLPGGCTEVGTQDPYGDILRGATMVTLATERVHATAISSAFLRIFYPLDNAGRPVDCARIMADPAAGALNVVGYYTTAIRSQGYEDFVGALGPVYLPANDAATPYLVYVAMFSGDRDPISHDPTGALLAEGCEAGMVVAAGEPADWANPGAGHQFSGLVATTP